MLIGVHRGVYSHDLPWYRPDLVQHLLRRCDLRRIRAISDASRPQLRAVDAELEQKLSRSVTQTGRFSSATQLGVDHEKFANSIVALISVIAATSGDGELARGGPMLVFGAGALGCGVWLQHAEPADDYHVVMASWIDGYLTAANENRGEVSQIAVDQSTKGTPFDAWISRYCEANTQAPLFRAASALFLDLAKR